MGKFLKDYVTEASIMTGCGTDKKVVFHRKSMILSDLTFI